MSGRARGGDVIESSYPGKLVRLSDGTTIGIRPTSTSGGPTIDIKLPSGEILKIHVGS